ncbi:MAG: WD40 repeat domain-containing protein, partial [Phycisphaerae bacterium]
GERLPMPGLRHRKWLIDMTFSLDGKWLATGAADNVVLLANLASGEVRRLHHESWPNALAFSPDSQLLASGSRNGIVRIWKVATGEPYGTPMQTEVARVEELAFSPDGTLLATGTKTGTVRLWSTADCQVHGTPVTHAEDIRELCFTPDGARLFSRVPCGFMMWNVRSTPLSKRTWTHDSHVHAVAFSPDGRRVAVSDRGQIQLRRADTGEPEGLSIDVPQYAVALAFTQGGRRLAGVTLRGDVYRWDVEAGTPPQPAWSLEGVQWGGRRNTAVFGRDGALLATVEEDATRLRRADTGELHGPKGEFKRGGAAAIGPDGKLLVAATYGLDTLLYDIQTGKLLSELHHPEHIRCVTFGPEGKRLAVSVANKRTRVYDVATWRPVGRWMENRGVVYRMAFSPDGKLLAAAEGNVVQLWNLDRGPVPHGTPLPHDGTIFDLTFGPDGQSLLVGSAAGEDGSKGMLTMWQLPAVPADVREMQLRTWLTLGARRGPNRETEAVPWQRSQEYRQELRRLGARRP